MIKLNYRPEIDALRALAVGAVIIYHAKIFLFGHLIFPGGFLGVDIFFVISGYLISSLIFKELKIKKTFDFKNFYERRIRRILPALLTVILVSIPFAWIYVLPTSFVDFSKSIIYSLGFGSNFYFYFTGQEYGAESGLLKPLLHTWSLSIEEQFYIIFPLFFFFTFKYFRKYNFVVIILIVLISIVFSQFLSSANSSLNFYLLFTRAWELLLGTLLVFFEDSRKEKVSNFNSNFLVILGLILIISSFFIFESSIGHPSIKSIIPVVGVIMIIYFSKPNTFTNIFLSNRLFVGVGLISYSLYLWHYPIFAFSRIGYFTHNIFHYGIVAIVIFGLSVLTYFFVEKPFRSKEKMSLKKVIIILFSLFILLIAISLSVIKNKGFVERFPLEDKFSLDNLKYSKEVRLKKYETGSPNFKSKNKTKILVFGNSHGRDFFNYFILNKNLFTDYEFSMIDGQVRCLESFAKYKKLCKKNVPNKLYDIFKKSDVIIISQSYFAEDLKNLDSAIKVLKDKKKKVVLTSQFPSFYFKNSKGLLDEFFYENKRLPSAEEILIIEKKNYELIDNRDIEINKKISKVAEENNVKLLNKKEYMCVLNEKRCFVITNDKDKILFNTDHTTLSGARFFGEIIYKTGWLKID